MMISPRKAWKILFAFIFHLSGWALVAPSCFALQVPDVRGLQVPGPPCASFLLKFWQILGVASNKYNAYFWSPIKQVCICGLRCLSGLCCLQRSPQQRPLRHLRPLIYLETTNIHYIWCLQHQVSPKKGKLSAFHQ